MLRIIPHPLDNAQSFRSPLSKQYSISDSQIFWSLHEPERHLRSVSGTYVIPIDVDDSAGLRDGSYVQHGLIFRLDSGRVGKD